MTKNRKQLPRKLFYVTRVVHNVHRYKHHRCGPSRCVKCGTWMRRLNPAAAPEYRTSGARTWIALHPDCPPIASSDVTAKNLPLVVLRRSRR